MLKRETVLGIYFPTRPKSTPGRTSAGCRTSPGVHIKAIHINRTVSSREGELPRAEHGHHSTTRPPSRWPCPGLSNTREAAEDKVFLSHLELQGDAGQ